MRHSDLQFDLVTAETTVLRQCGESFSIVQQSTYVYQVVMSNRIDVTALLYMNIWSLRMSKEHQQNTG